MSIQCQWHDQNRQGCTQEATWQVWLKRNAKVKVYLCDDHTVHVANYHTKNGGIDGVDGLPIGHGEQNTA